MNLLIESFARIVGCRLDAFHWNFLTAHHGSLKEDEIVRNMINDEKIE